MPKWLFLFNQMGRRLWLTAALYSVLGLVAALLATVFGPYVPEDFPLKLGSEAVDEILTILASSMLAVATFSLTTLVTAYTAVMGNVSPHAARLLVSDGAVRTSLATFVGAFIYAMVGIVALHTGYYGAQGRVILFFITLLVLALVVLAMLRWIGELSAIGQADDVIDRVAETTAKALRSSVIVNAWREQPYNPPSTTLEIRAEGVGFVRNIDLAGLERVAEEAGLTVYVETSPGAFVHAAQTLMKVTGSPLLDTELTGRLRSKMSIGPRRTFDQDPRYGLTVLGEIASRALSPGINDPGTARDVLSTTVELLSEWAQEMVREGPKQTDGPVRMRPVSAPDLLDDALGPIAEHGAAMARLQVELQTGLLALASVGDTAMTEAARRQSRVALERAKRAISLEIDKRRVAEAAFLVEERPLS